MTIFPTAVAHTPPELWQRYANTKSEHLRNRIARQNDLLAIDIVHRMKCTCAENIEDLEQIARIGLIKAIERFDPNTGAAFSSFAVPYIRGEILHFNRDHGYGHLKIPRRAFEEVGKVRNLCRELELLGRKIEPVYAARAVGISKEKWEWLQDAVQRKQLAIFEDQLHLAEDDETEAIDLSREHHQLQRAIATLPKLKRQCVEEFWFYGKSEAAIARLHKLPVQQVQTVLNEAFEQLKKQLLKAG